MGMLSEFKPSFTPPAVRNPEAFWFVYSGYRLLVRDSHGTAVVPTERELQACRADIGHPLFLGYFRGRACYAAQGTLPGESPAGAGFRELRSLFGILEPGLYEIALLGVHLAQWESTCRFCSRCRSPLRQRTDMRARECPECGRLEFPRISPAIIVLVERGDTLLLARSTRFPGAFFSVLAGFVEPGESLEEAVLREVEEETGIVAKDIAYFGSQPWPFPDSLMVGFTAQYASGEIRVDGEEIAEAGWYTRDRLPEIPGRLSIARQLIDWFVNKPSLPGKARE